MSVLTLNGFNVLRGTIRLPRVGVWNADLVVDSLLPISGAVTLASDDGSFSLVGSAFREGVFQNTLSMRVLGGAGGLATVLPAKFYAGVTLGFVLTDTLTACGEKLSTATSDATVLATPLAKWARIQGTGLQAVARLLDRIATSWRILPSGQLWVGTDTYPAAPGTQFDLLERYYGEGRVRIGSARPFLMPGTALTISQSATQGTQNVSYVVHEIEADKIRTEVYFERTAVVS